MGVFVIQKLTGHLVGKVEETRWLGLCQKAIECLYCIALEVSQTRRVRSRGERDLVCYNIKHSINGKAAL